MPLLKIIKNPHYQLSVWTLEETDTELSRLIDLSERDLFLIEKFTSQYRKREFRIVRILLSGLLGFYPEIAHDEQNRPFLTNSSLRLSISHSRSLVAVILSEKPVGVDTEETNRDASHIARRFMNTDEISWTLTYPDPNRARILCWSIKESVFKLMQTDEVDFRSMIRIDPVEPADQGTAAVSFLKNEITVEIKVNYLFESNNVITWCESP